jgi:hypothetical protein
MSLQLLHGTLFFDTGSSQIIASNKFEFNLKRKVVYVFKILIMYGLFLRT